jgi:hypothetical protein
VIAELGGSEIVSVRSERPVVRIQSQNGVFEMMLIFDMQSLFMKECSSAFQQHLHSISSPEEQIFIRDDDKINLGKS